MVLNYLLVVLLRLLGGLGVLFHMGYYFFWQAAPLLFRMGWRKQFFSLCLLADGRFPGQNLSSKKCFPEHPHFLLFLIDCLLQKIVHLFCLFELIVRVLDFTCMIPEVLSALCKISLDP